MFLWTLPRKLITKVVPGTNPTLILRSYFSNPGAAPGALNYERST